MTKWEYRWKPLVTSDINQSIENLNVAGYEGWELVTVIAGADNKAPSGLPIAILKRPKSDNSN